jgi:hypothetical protein
LALVYFGYRLEKNIMKGTGFNILNRPQQAVVLWAVYGFVVSITGRAKALVPRKKFEEGNAGS